MTRKKSIKALVGDDLLIQKLSALEENDFSRDVLIPLFGSMGYDRVEFYGGVLERGRDLVATRRLPPRSTPYVHLIQSKRIATIAPRVKAPEFSRLLHQLRQCCTGTILAHDGSSLSVDEVTLACPEVMPQRLLDEIASQLRDMPRMVRIYDGPQILAHIREYCPGLLERFSTVRDRLIALRPTDLSNQELLSVLAANDAPELTTFYCDLGFFVGSVDSHFLLHLRAQIDTHFVSVAPARWTAVASQLSETERRFGFKLTIESLTDIESAFATQRTACEARDNQAALEERVRLGVRLEQLRTSTEAEFFRIEKSALEQSQRKETNNSERLLDALRRLSEILKRDASCDPAAFMDANSTAVLAVVESHNERVRLQQRLDEIEQYVIQPPSYVLTLNANEITESIRARTANYLSGMQEIQAHKTSIERLRGFLLDTRDTLAFLATLRDETFELREHFRFNSTASANDRITISPHDIFSSGLNIAVYGGAGVGKTTTLKAYVHDAVRAGRTDVVYVPLNAVVDKIAQIRGPKYQEEKKTRPNAFLARLILVSRGLDPTTEATSEAEQFLRSGIKLILDGLDEAFDRLPDLIPEIADFHANNPRSQLIVSSRDCVSYLKQIDFLGITLLPFTKDQLIAFIRAWVPDIQASEGLIDAVEHRGLSDHIKTPLLATIACVLANKGVKVATNEREFYAERLRLLSGEYDRAKGIVRQRHAPNLLQRVAVKLGYAMHCEMVRSLKWEALVTLAQQALQSSMASGLVTECLEDLHNPCNILIRDSETHEFSFGHFRFQEHLAAEELRSNRDADIVARTTKDWWRGALGLYAQDADVSGIIEEVYRSDGSLRRASETLAIMAANAPRAQQAGLRQLLRAYRQQDELEGAMFLGLHEF